MAEKKWYSVDVKKEDYETVRTFLHAHKQSVKWEASENGEYTHVEFECASRTFKTIYSMLEENNFLNNEDLVLLFKQFNPEGAKKKEKELNTVLPEAGHYYKGQMPDGSRMVVQIYSTPHDDVFEEGKVNALQIRPFKDGSIIELGDISDIEKEKYYISREISEEEFRFYTSVMIVMTEIYMHDFTGGFPNKDRCVAMMSDAKYHLTNTLKQFSM